MGDVFDRSFLFNSDFFVNLSTKHAFNEWRWFLYNLQESATNGNSSASDRVTLLRNRERECLIVELNIRITFTFNWLWMSMYRVTFCSQLSICSFTCYFQKKNKCERRWPFIFCLALISFAISAWFFFRICESSAVLIDFCILSGTLIWISEWWSEINKEKTK